MDKSNKHKKLLSDEPDQKRDCQYYKLHHRDGEPHSKMEIRTFIEVCERFIADTGNQRRAHGSTHGINRWIFYNLLFNGDTQNLCQSWISTILPLQDSLGLTNMIISYYYTNDMGKYHQRSIFHEKKIITISIPQIPNIDSCSCSR